jgi:hypothetical protein
LLLLIVPAVLFTFAATRLAIFRPRYLIVVTPAVILPLAGVLSIGRNRRVALAMRPYEDLPYELVEKQDSKLTSRHTSFNQYRNLLNLALIIVIGLSLLALDEYFYHYQKAADWRGLSAYLHRVTTANDMVIITAADEFGSAAPEFYYYYRGPAKVLVLPYPNYDMQAALREDFAKYRSLYLVPQGTLTQQVIAALDENGSFVRQEDAGGFSVRQYQSKSDH